MRRDSWAGHIYFGPEEREGVSDEARRLGGACLLGQSRERGDWPRNLCLGTGLEESDGARRLPIGPGIPSGLWARRDSARARRWAWHIWTLYTLGNGEGEWCAPKHPPAPARHVLSLCVRATAVRAAVCVNQSSMCDMCVFMYM